jgi:hypothetical protein
MLGGYDEETGKFVEIGQSNYKVKKLKEEFEKEYCICQAKSVPNYI